MKNILDKLSKVIGSVLILEIIWRLVFIPHLLNKLGIKEEGERYIIEQPLEHKPDFINKDFIGITHSTNSFGFRDKERKIEKPDNTIRIAAIGDSWTYGNLVNMEGSYPYTLEKMLNSCENSCDKRYEIWNMGIGKFVPKFDFVVYEKFFEKHNPNFDLVFFGYSLEDIERSPMLRLYFQQQKAKKSFLPAVVLSLYSLIDYVRKIDMWGGVNYNENEYKSVDEIFNRFYKLAKRYKFDGWVIIFPDRKAGDYQNSIADRIEQLAIKNKMGVLNLCPILTAIRSPKFYDWETFMTAIKNHTPSPETKLISSILYRSIDIPCCEEDKGLYRKLVY